MFNIRRYYATAACALCMLLLVWPFNLLFICLINYASILVGNHQTNRDPRFSQERLHLVGLNDTLNVGDTGHRRTKRDAGKG
jgi:hypothetical protein